MTQPTDLDRLAAAHAAATPMPDEALLPVLRELIWPNGKSIDAAQLAADRIEQLRAERDAGSITHDMIERGAFALAGKEFASRYDQARACLRAALENEHG